MTKDEKTINSALRQKSLRGGLSDLGGNTASDVTYLTNRTGTLPTQTGHDEDAEAIVLPRIWSFIRNSKNREVVSWLGGGGGTHRSGRLGCLHSFCFSPRQVGGALDGDHNHAIWTGDCLGT